MAKRRKHRASAGQDARSERPAAGMGSPERGARQVPIADAIGLPERGAAHGSPHFINARTWLAAADARPASA